MFAPKIDFLPGMFVRFDHKALGTDTQGLPAHLPIVGQVADGDFANSLLPVEWWQKSNSCEPIPQHTELPRRALTRFFLPPDTPCMQTSSRARGVILCHDQPTNTLELVQYFVKIHDAVHRISEHELRVVTDDVSANPLELLLTYSFSSPERKQRRDRLVQRLAEVQHATFGLAELITGRLNLLAHQAEAVARVLADPVCRYMLADEVGLGKTIEASLILSALRNQDASLPALILAPAALLPQWERELHLKFNIPIQRGTPRDSATWNDSHGLLVAYEDLDACESLWHTALNRRWGLLIADEAHNLRRHPMLYDKVRQLSRSAARALILTATPVQRRAEEYLDLLRLMHPTHYASVDPARFDRMLKTQTALRESVNYLARGMDPEYFDADEFIAEMQQLATQLDDPVLPDLVSRIQSTPECDSLALASEALRYVSDNYRIESRVIRNRRANLSSDILPVRQLNADCMYDPMPLERKTLESLHDYADALLRGQIDATGVGDYCRCLFHAAASSPTALLQLLKVRSDHSVAKSALRSSDPVLKQFADMSRKVVAFPNETQRLDNLNWYAERWNHAMDRLLDMALGKFTAYDKPYRLAQVIRTVRLLVRRRPGVKVLVFSTFLPTLEILRKHLETLLGIDAVAEFSARLEPDMLQTEADWFQKSEACHVLLSDETGGEGRNFQIADAIIHVDLPWTPAQIEQRIGRVDRLGRNGTVTSYVPVARGTVEEDLFNLWHKGYGIFEHSISGLEIALEEVQNQVMQAFAANTRHGLAEMLPWLTDQANELRSTVEEERYFDEGAINWRRRNEFERIGERYQDGEWLRKDILEWAGVGGKKCYYNAQTEMTLIGPAGADLAEIAKRVESRTQRLPDKVLAGTFHRSVAITREDLTFFTLGQRHIKKIVEIGLNHARGRCCAIQRSVRDLHEDWRGFEFLYGLSVDTRPLLAANLPTCHLRRVQGYLPDPTLRVVVDVYGNVVPAGSPLLQWIRPESGLDHQINLGGSSKHPGQTEKFKGAYPADEWQAMVAQAADAAEYEVKRRLAVQREERVAEARQELEQGIAGQWAAYRWLYGEADSTRVTEISQLELANAALLSGLEYPRWQLESVCFWELKGRDVHG